MRKAKLGLAPWPANHAVALGLLCVHFALRASGPVPLSTDLVLGKGPRELTFNPNGALVAWTGLFDEKQKAGSTPAGELRYGDQILPLESPRVSRTKSQLSFTYDWPAQPDLQVILRHELKQVHGAVLWTREFQIRSKAKLASHLTVSLQSWPASLPHETWLPLINGTGATLGTNDAAAFRFAGDLPCPDVPLALPMACFPVTNLARRILIATDPYFSTLFKPTVLEWSYLPKAGLENGCESRTVVVAEHQGSVEDSLACFFTNLLPEVVPGPAWLHDIALVDFDYLSDGGQGWFRDIDALTTALPKRDRHRVFFCLHGWYDFLGRYCFDARTRELDREWTAFSSYELARNAHPYGTIGGERVKMGFANCKPARMSLAEMHRRLRYARDKGFRAGLYFADGLNSGDGLADFNPARVLQWGGWQGPDSKGKSYFQNPLAPEVRTFFLDYTKALLAEFGPDMDALVWDETFHVPCGKLGTDAWPGYADRAMMRLVREVTALVDDYNHRHRRQIAFLTSDCLGAFGDKLVGPYALVSHGTYQDSWCQPNAWSYGIFANYRNVLWSCCWWHVTKWRWVDFGVREYQAPVSISNGWGDNTGFSELTPSQQARVIELFNWRKQHPTQLKWFDHLPEATQANLPGPP
jgi:hypothetical protein